MKRITALAGAELKLLVRNKTLLTIALAMPLLMALLLVRAADSSQEMGQGIIMSVMSFALLFVVYYNLVSTFVARRQDLVLKRFRAGQWSNGEILLATSSPALLITLAQAIIAVVVAQGLIEDFRGPNPILMIVALGLGAAVFTLLALVTASVTRTVEAAQMSTTPLFLVTLLFGGILFPLELFPGIIAEIGRWTPLYPVGAFIEQSFATSLDWSQLWQPALALTLWIGVGYVMYQRMFRWEPRV